LLSNHLRLQPTTKKRRGRSTLVERVKTGTRARGLNARPLGKEIGNEGNSKKDSWRTGKEV